VWGVGNFVYAIIILPRLQNIENNLVRKFEINSVMGIQIWSSGISADIVPSIFIMI
jgi:hypothetical protein